MVVSAVLVGHTAACAQPASDDETPDPLALAEQACLSVHTKPEDNDLPLTELYPIRVKETAKGAAQARQAAALDERFERLAAASEDLAAQTKRAAETFGTDTDAYTELLIGDPLSSEGGPLLQAGTEADAACGALGLES